MTANLNPYDEQDRARLEADYGPWLDRQIAHESSIMLGIDVDIYAAPRDGMPPYVVAEAGEQLPCLPADSGRRHDGSWTRVHYQGHACYARRTQLLDAIAATADDVARAERQREEFLEADRQRNGRNF